MKAVDWDKIVGCAVLAWAVTSPFVAHKAGSNGGETKQRLRMQQQLVDEGHAFIEEKTGAWKLIPMASAAIRFPVQEPESTPVPLKIPVGKKR